MRVVAAKGRSFASVYTDAETRHYEGMLRQASHLAMRGLPLLDGPLRVAVEALFSVPASWSQKKRADALGGILRPGKPDCDNIAKVVDACNGVIWVDDSQIFEMHIIKAYAEKPSLEIRVYRAA